MLASSFLATSVNFLTFSILACPSGALSLATVSLKKAAFVAYRESSGMPSLYFPVSMPEERGDQMVVPARSNADVSQLDAPGEEVGRRLSSPVLYLAKMGAYSTSNRSR